MGLDMWIRRCTPVSDEELILFKHKDIGALDEFLTFEVSTLSDDVKALIKDLMPILKTAEFSAKKWDLTKIREDYKIPDNAYVSSYGYNKDGFHMSFSWKEKDDYKSSGDLKIDEDKYLYTDVSQYYICRYEDVYYWRKDYELQEAIYDELKQVENCGYHLLNKENICKLFKNRPEVMEEIGDNFENLYYHEWY